MHYEYVEYVSGSRYHSQYFTYCVFYTKRFSAKLRWLNLEGDLNNIYGPALIRFRPNGTILRAEYWIDADHRNDYGPAVKKYYPDGTIACIEHRIHSELHNEHGPALITYHSNGTISSIGYFHQDMPHNEHEPAIIRYSTDGTIISALYYFMGQCLTKAQHRARHVKPRRILKS